MENKKGQLGLEMATAFVLAIMILAIIIFALIVSLSNLANTNAADIDQPTSGFVNETTTAMNATGYQVAGTALLDNCALTLDNVLNGTINIEINTGNFTITGCFINASTALAPYLNDLWNITGSYEHTSDDDIQNSLFNVTGGASNDLMANAGTWFALISVVIIILIITIVIVAVNRFGSGMGGGSNNSTGDFT